MCFCDVCLQLRRCRDAMYTWHVWARLRRNLRIITRRRTYHSCRIILAAWHRTARRLRWGRVSSMILLARRVQGRVFREWQRTAAILRHVRHRLQVIGSRRRQQFTRFCVAVMRQWRCEACRRIMARVLQRKHELARLIPRVRIVPCCFV